MLVDGRGDDRHRIPPALSHTMTATKGDVNGH
jgi:hypothetical protein